MNSLLLLCEPPRASVYRLPMGVRVRIITTVLVVHALVAWIYGMHMDPPPQPQPTEETSPEAGH